MSGVKSGVAEQEGQLAWIVPPNGSGPSPEQDAERAKTAKLAWSLKEAGKKWRDVGNFKDAKTNWGYWNERGQWAYQRPNHLHMSVVGQVYPTIETFIGHFADNIPDSVARARDPKHGRVAEMATKLFNWANDINRVQGQNEILCRSAAVAGFSVQRVDWDETMDGNRGAPKFSFVDETTFLVSPWTTDPYLSDARWVCQPRNLPIEIVRQRWPEYADEIRPGAWDGSLTPDFMQGDGKGFAEYLTMPAGGGTVAAGGANSKAEARDLCTLIECWIRKEDGTIRYIAVANAITLQDGPSPYEDEEFPYVVYNVLRDKDSAYGHSLVHWMKSTQDELNLMHSYMMDGMRFSSVDRVVVNQANLEEGKMLSNDPSAALVDQTPDGRGYYLLHQGQGGTAFMDVEELLIKRLNEKTGNVDILHGERPAGVTTLGAMEIIRDEANVLVKKMSIQLMDGMKRRDELCLNRIRQFLKDERTVRITGRGGNQEHITVNKKVGTGLDGEWIVANTIPEDFEADIDITPLPPGGVAAKFEQATAMLQSIGEDGLPLITRNTFMKMTEQDPQLVAENEEEIAVMAEQQAKAQQAEAQAAQGGAPVEDEEMSPDEMRVRAMRLLGGGS